jgi:hypothetical protein
MLNDVSVLSSKRETEFPTVAEHDYSENAKSEKAP